MLSSQTSIRQLIQPVVMVVGILQRLSAEELAAAKPLLVELIQTITTLQKFATVFEQGCKPANPREKVSATAALAAFKTALQDVCEHLRQPQYENLAMNEVAILSTMLGRLEKFKGPATAFTGKERAKKEGAGNQLPPR